MLNEFFRIVFPGKKGVVDSCLALCCLRFSSCNPQRVKSANFPVICLKFTSWKWKVNHFHALMYNYACTAVAVAKHFGSKAQWSVKGTPAALCNRFSRWPSTNLYSNMQSCWQQITRLVTSPQTHIWHNFNSLSMTATKKTRKINLPSSGNWQVHVALSESCAFPRSCIPLTRCNLFIIACCCHKLKNNQYWIKIE